jgi:hypothetical protein
MAKYKIIPISHALKNNVIANHGDIVEESQLTASVYDLIKDGFIEKVEGSDIVEEDPTKEDVDDADGKGEADTETDVDPEKEEEVEEDPKEEVKAPVAEVSKKDEVIGKFKK